MRADPLSLVLAAGLACAAPALAAERQFANAPFESHPVALAQAAALERIGARIRAAEADPDATASEESDADGDLALIRASLGAASPATLGALESLLDGAEPAPGAPKDPVAAARDLLAPPDVAGTAPFRAALAAALLLDEGGVAEGWEEVAEGEPEARALGGEELRSVERILGGPGGDDLSGEAAEMLARLDALFASEAVNPEEAEGIAQPLVGLLEVISDSDLYPGRDLGGAAALVLGLSRQGCAALARGDGAIGAERLAIARRYHDALIADTLGLMAPEAGATISAAFEPRATDDPAEACDALLGALAAARTALTP
ncbi:hypothetical protein [Amaricoccus solimangrovi]|uniref:hypothetical protein n=1 Tax=Amaricoccus solimangrovi TaxID=2589815 RepID=UPI0015E41316|nr:hypothetical protein [Amaricoccus solimangrovi]